MNSIIEAKGIGKRFGKAWAVQDADLEVRPGEVFGLVGPDGAGKSTLIRMLTGNLEPSSGSALILGHDPSTRRGAAAIRVGVGYLSQGLSLYQDLTVLENLRFCASLFGVADATTRMAMLLEATGLQNHSGKLASALSGGMRQKLGLICALVNRPQLVFLDEPSTGVDPVSRREFWDLISRFQQEGVTFVVSTPYMEEAERCGRVAFMISGRILAIGSPAAFKDEFDRAVYEVVFAEGTEAIAAARQVGQELPVRVVGDRLRIFGSPAAGGVELVERAVRQFAGSQTSIRRSRPSLEDVFVSLIRG